MNISVGISNRHVHLKKEHLSVLFGDDYSFNKVRDLKQPNQFVTDAFVTLKTEKGKIDNVRVLGPLRDYTQVEISLTDAYKLGLKPPIRESGDLLGSETITIVGPIGEIEALNSTIIAERHIHLNHQHRIQYGLENKDKVSILIRGEKSGIINNVYLKESEDSFFELHLDTDDANAFMLHNGDIVEILKEDL